MASNSDLIRRWFEEVWNEGREQTIDEMCTPDAVGLGKLTMAATSLVPKTSSTFGVLFAPPLLRFTLHSIRASRRATSRCCSGRSR